VGVTVVAVLSALALVGHSRSEGRSRFEIQPGDRVGISVQLLTLDLPELCEVDLSLSDPDRQRREAQRFEACVERGLPRWLRLSTDGGACAVSSSGTRRGEGLEVFIDGVAACPPLAGHTLTIDWGFFAGQRLDHVSTATVAPAPGVEERTLLSRRHNRARVKIPRAFPDPVEVGVGVVVVAVLVVVVGGLRRRRRRSHEGRRAGGVEDGAHGA